MTFDVNPAELLAAALTCAVLAVPIAAILAGCAVAAPRRAWNGAGLAVGLGLLAGVALAGTMVFTGPGGTPEVIGAAAMILGLLAAVATGVLTALRRAGTLPAAVSGISACALVSIGEPVQTVPALFGMTSSVLVVLAAVVVELVALVVVLGALVPIAARAPAARFGLSVAAGLIALLALISALMRTAGGDGIPSSAMLTGTLLALVIGCAAGIVLEIVRGRAALGAEEDPAREPAA